MVVRLPLVFIICVGFYKDVKKSILFPSGKSDISWLEMTLCSSIESPRSVLRLIRPKLKVVSLAPPIYWDLVLDGGLLNMTSKNPRLRDKLLVPQKKVYFIADGEPKL